MPGFPNYWAKVNFVHSQPSSYGGTSDKGMLFKNLQVAPPDSGLVWGALAFTLRATRFFGTAPVSFVRARRCWKVQLSPLMSIYSYIFIIMLNLLVFGGITTYEYETHGADIRGFGYLWVLDDTMVAVISTYGVFSGPFWMKQFIMCLDQINKVLSTLKREYIMRKQEKILCWIIVFFAIGVIFMFVGDAVFFVNSTGKRQMSTFQFSLYSFKYVEIFILDLLELQFVLTAFLPYTVLQCVNKDLTSLTIDIQWKNSTSHSKKIRRLSQAYSATCDVARKVDKSNGMLLLLLLVAFLMHMVITPFYVITLLLNRQLEFLMQIVWGVYHIIKLFMIVEPGRRMQQEIKKTQTLVAQLMNRASSPKDPIVDELNLFYKQILLNPVEFSPLGICILGRPLIASVLGAVTTYLVILVQFQNFHL